jgi:hypothetical protein
MMHQGRDPGQVIEVHIVQPPRILRRGWSSVTVIWPLSGDGCEPSTASRT